MCLATWLPTTATLWYFLRLVGWLLVLAGCLFVLLSVTIRPLRKWYATKFRTSASFPLYITSRIVAVLTALTLGSKRAVSIILITCWMSCGYMIKAAQDHYERNDRERSYPIRIFEKLDERHVLVCKSDTDGRCLTETFKFATCSHEVAPAFDAGKLYDVAFEISDDSTGECNTFTGENGKFKEMP